MNQMKESDGVQAVRLAVGRPEGLHDMSGE
jgi:hypothetical protein